jgi:hypothetical protein
MMACGTARAQEHEWRPADALKEDGGLRPPQKLQGRANPSLDYFRVWDDLPNARRRDLGEAASNATHEKGAKLDKNARRLCEENRDYVVSLMRLANAGPCDWGIMVENGWFALLPHISFLRQSARILRMDAYRCIEDGSTQAAAERLAAIVRMSDQTRGDQVMICALVGAAICTTGVNTTEEMIHDHQLNPASARIILNAMKDLPKDDLFGAAASLERERYFSIDWVQRKFTGEFAGLQMMREIGGFHPTTQDPLNLFIYGMNQERMAADLARFGKYFDAAGAAWKKPDSQVLLNELTTEVAEGQYGAIARVLAPSIERVATVVAKARADLARTRGRLEAIVMANEAGTQVQTR